VQLVKDHPGVEIKLLCHSMGGLVARVCLEGADAGTRPWAAAVTLAVYLATPHEGAPMAFARATGVGGSALGVSEEDLQRLCAVPGYPAAYQLFPPARLEPMWDLEDLMPFKTRSLFDPGLVAPFHLNPGHLDAAAAFHGSIDFRRKLVGCRYFTVVSAAHETVTRFNQDSGVASPVKVKSSGDGTVPILSAAALPIQTALVEANHLGVTQKPVTHRILGMLLGRIPAGPVIAVAGVGMLSLSISQRAIGEGETVEIVINVSGMEKLNAVIHVRRGPGEGSLVDVLEIPITVETPGLTRVQFAAPYLDPGRYELDLVVGDKRTDHEELLVSRSARN
jgi:phospholipase A1